MAAAKDRHYVHIQRELLKADIRYWDNLREVAVRNIDFDAACACRDEADRLRRQLKELRTS